MPLQTPSIANEELLRLAVEATVGYAIFAMDEQGNVMSWNVGAERLLGYREADILGRSADVIFTPEDRLAGEPERERQTARTHDRAEDERWHQRKDGSQFWGSGLLTRLPQGSGFMKIMRDHTDRHVAESRIKASEARFRTLATNIPQLVFASLPTGSRTWGSPQWILFTGLDEPHSLEFGWLNAIHPEDRELTMDAWRRASQTGRYEVEHRIRRAATDQYRWHQTRANPLHADAPATTEWVGTSSDIHELRGLKESQDVLLAELQHRTRNLIAMVQAIARRSARTSSTMAAFVTDFEQRMRALSRAQSVLPASGEGTIDIRILIDTELAAHAEASRGDRVLTKGESVGIPVGSAQVVALALHELSTNAVKYGALHEESGRLMISWTVDDDASGPVLHVVWRETGVSVPPASDRTRKGYGSELIERALPYQLGASTHLEFVADGVRCDIRIPLQPGQERD
jgi:PAS domain S-box-containing protein